METICNWWKLTFEIFSYKRRQNINTTNVVFGACFFCYKYVKKWTFLVKLTIIQLRKW